MSRSTRTACQGFRVVRMLKSAIPDSVESFTGCCIRSLSGVFVFCSALKSVTVSDEVLYFLLMPLLYTVRCLLSTVIVSFLRSFLSGVFFFCSTLESVIDSDEILNFLCLYYIQYVSIRQQQSSLFLKFYSFLFTSTS
jgi:hypothetical protein